MINSREFSLFKKRESDSRIAGILRLIIYSLFFLSVALIFCLEKKQPFNYIIIVLWGLFSISSVFYIIFYGKVKIDCFAALILIFPLLQLVSWAINGFSVFNYTSLLMAAMSLIIYEIIIQKSFKKQLFFNLLIISTWVFILFFLAYNFRSLLSFSLNQKLDLSFGNSNDIARSLSYAFAINFSIVFIAKKKFLKILFFPISLLPVVMIFMIGSVSNLLTCCLCIVIIPLFLAPKKYKIITVIVSVAVIVLFLVLMNLPFMSYYRNRITNMFNSFMGNGSRGDASFEGRFRGAYYGFVLFLNKPFFGNGFDAVNMNYIIMAHNNVAEVAADFGVFALLIEEFFIIFPLFKIIKFQPNKQGLFSPFLPLAFSALFFMLFFQLFLVSFNSKIESIMIPMSFSLLGLKDLKVDKIKICISGEKYDYYRIDI